MTSIGSLAPNNSFVSFPDVDIITSAELKRLNSIMLVHATKDGDGHIITSAQITPRSDVISFYVSPPPTFLSALGTCFPAKTANAMDRN